LLSASTRLGAKAPSGPNRHRVIDLRSDKSPDHVIQGYRRGCP
jgi:hypothetical protein